MERPPSFSVSFYLPANILKLVILYLQRLIITTREALYNIPEEEKKKVKSRNSCREQHNLLQSKLKYRKNGRQRKQRIKSSS